MILYKNDLLQYDKHLCKCSTWKAFTYNSSDKKHEITNTLLMWDSSTQVNTISISYIRYK